MKSDFRFPYPTTPSHGAWCMAVGLIGHADFDQPRPTVVLHLEELFAQPETVTQEWLEEAIGRAKEFNMGVYDSADFEDSDFTSMCMFTRMGYRNFPNRIEADLHPDALPYLKQLQEAIEQLHQRGKLTPANLAKQIKAIAPLTVFGMKKNRRYEGPMLSLFRHKRQIVDTPVG